jgi:hypothetical protein
LRKRGEFVVELRPLSRTLVCCCATLVEPAHHLCDGLIHFVARPLFLAVFGERQLGAENLNAGKEFFQTREQRHPIDGSDHVVLRRVEYDLTGHKVLSIAIRHNGDDQVALDALYLASKHRADADHV